MFTLFVREIDEAFSQRKSKKVSVASPQTFLIGEQTSADILYYTVHCTYNMKYRLFDQLRLYNCYFVSLYVV